MRFRFLFSLLFSLTVFSTSSASAFEEINTGYFNNLALQGYDTASYLTDNTAIEGTKSYSFMWKETEWLFVDAKSRDLFALDPEGYAPQFGGYCSNQMSLGNLSDIDPGVWLIHKEKLYFFGHQAGKDRWQRTGIDARIEDARHHWENYLAQ